MENAINPEIHRQVMLDIYAMPAYRELKEKQRVLIKNGDYMKASMIGQKMKRIEAKV